VNHPPVAIAGVDQSVAEGSPVTLNGGASYDPDGDTFIYTWEQVSGPSVTLTDPHSASPTFTAPTADTGGSPGVISTVAFELTVSDGFPFDAPAPGYADFTYVADTVTIDITNINHAPIATAEPRSARSREHHRGARRLHQQRCGRRCLTYAWTQVRPDRRADERGGGDCGFTARSSAVVGRTSSSSLTVDDGYGGSSTDRVLVAVRNVNDPPACGLARPSVAALWPPDHRLVSVGVLGVSDPNGNATITITGVTQDEATCGLGDGDTGPDAIIAANGTVLLRAERSGKGNGRVYHIHFTVSDYEGSCAGVVEVRVPRDRRKRSVAVDGGELIDSTKSACCKRGEKGDGDDEDETEDHDELN
jgi:hypothetical protein